ncbi:MAG: AAA family ATPase [Cyanobacteriota bacterium]|nr:AAA family ATPase [Cyanobacteriota bacterium]
MSPEASPATAQTEPPAHPLIQALIASPGAWPHPVCEPIGLVETHISWVLLTGNYAYKIHKPVNLGFLDFTSLEKRLTDCQEELRLNRRLSSDLYCDLMAVVGSDSHPHLIEASALSPPVASPGSAQGAVRDYALRMHQFPQHALLPAVLQAGGVSPAAIDALANDLAHFHQHAAVADPGGPFGTPEAVRQPVLANFAALEPRLPTEHRSRLAVLRQWEAEQFHRLSPRMGQRLAQRRVRECHGDLHLGNMLMRGGRIRVFDCLEFSPSLRWIDVISDMAFLVMDLEERGQPQLANRLLNGWLEANGDYGGLDLWHWYVSYRALVRAKVAALSGPWRADGSGEAYLAVAERCLEPGQPALLLLHGLSGSGKSHLSERLAAELGAIRLRSDVERKRWFGQWGLCSEPGDPPPYQGDPYAPAVGEALFGEHLPQLAADLLGAGFVVIVDATFLKERHRRAMAAVACSAAAPLRILSCSAPLPLLQQRVAARRQSGQDPSDADLAVLERQLLDQEPLTPWERARTVELSDAACPLPDLVAQLRRLP